VVRGYGGSGETGPSGERMGMDVGVGDLGWGEVDMRRPWIWVGSTRGLGSGLVSCRSPCGDVGVDLLEGVSGSSSSAPSAMSPSPGFASLLREEWRESGGGFEVEGEDAARRGSMDMTWLGRYGVLAQLMVLGVPCGMAIAMLAFPSLGGLPVLAPVGVGEIVVSPSTGGTLRVLRTWGSEGM
jgi:hypothetical protein